MDAVAQLVVWLNAGANALGRLALAPIAILPGWLSATLAAAATDAIETTIGPVRVQSKREICWNIKARAGGYQRLVFHVDDQTADKELAIGAGFMRVSTLRPGWSWSDTLLNPLEKPFGPDS